MTPNPGGLHVEATGSHTGYGDLLRACADAGKPLGLVKSVADGGALMEAKSVSAQTVTIWRKPVYWPGDSDDADNPPYDWGWPADQDASIAQTWMDAMSADWEEIRAYADYFEPVNEPNMATDAQLERFIGFTTACMRIAEQRNYKLAVGSFSAGCPSEEHMRALLPLLDDAARHGHILSVHDGSVDGERSLFRQAAEDGTGLRYRAWKRMATQAGTRFPQVAITEMYWPDGYRGRNPYDDFAWYLCELARDNVIGAAWFTLGDYSFDRMAAKMAKSRARAMAARAMEARGRA